MLFEHRIRQGCADVDAGYRSSEWMLTVKKNSNVMYSGGIARGGSGETEQQVRVRSLLLLQATGIN